MKLKFGFLLSSVFISALLVLGGFIAFDIDALASGQAKNAFTTKSTTALNGLILQERNAQPSSEEGLPLPPYIAFMNHLRGKWQVAFDAQNRIDEAKHAGKTVDLNALKKDAKEKRDAAEQCPERHNPEPKNHANPKGELVEDIILHAKHHLEGIAGNTYYEKPHALGRQECEFANFIAGKRVCPPPGEEKNYPWTHL